MACCRTKSCSARTTRCCSRSAGCAILSVWRSSPGSARKYCSITPAHCSSSRCRMRKEALMQGLTMPYQLTLPAMLRRAATSFGTKPIISYLPDGTRHQYTYTDLARRARALGRALQALGVSPGDRVATLAWNHYRHLEAFWGIPLSGAVLHALNIRLHGSDLAYIIGHAADRVLLVDRELLPVIAGLRGQIDIQHIIVFDAADNASDGSLA